MALAVDDISVGQFVTVESWNPREVHDFATVFGGGGETRIVEDQSYCGDVLEVVAVNLPYVVADNHNTERTVRLDTRRLSLIRLNEDYVEAAV